MKYTDSDDPVIEEFWREVVRALDSNNPVLKWSEVLRWLEKWGIEVENDSMDELEQIIKGNTK